jgi:hypothetical protein
MIAECSTARPGSSKVFVLFFGNRGTTYYKLGNIQSATENDKIAARLGNKGSQDFLRSSGIKW